MLWLLPLGAAIVALYLLRMRRRDVQVPATFLWPERTEEVRANALVQRLRFSWLLVLQLAALSLAVFALSRPQIKQRGLVGKLTVVVLDSSASMGATDVKPSRFEQAKAEVHRMIGSAAVGDRIALIEAGPVPRVVFPLGSDGDKQRSLLADVRRYDAESDMGEALRLASAIASANEAAKIVVLSDGVFNRVDDFAAGKANVVYTPYGKSSANLAVQAFGSNEGPKGRSVYCGVRNYGSEPAATGVTVYADGRAIDSVEATIGPGQTWGRTVAVPAGARVLEAKLDRGGALTADDWAVTLCDPAASVNVLLVTKGDLFLEKALSLDPRVTLDKADRLPESVRSNAAYDIVVFDGVPEQPVRARGVLTFGAAGPTSAVKTTGSVQTPRDIQGTNDPLGKGVSWDGVFVERMQRVEPKAMGRVVVDSKDGPVVVVSEGKSRQVYVAFEPMQSDFPLNVGFPILIGNALDFLIGRQAADTLSVKTGTSFVAPAMGRKDAGLTRPDGRRDTIEARDDRLAVRGLDRVGKYSLDLGGKAKAVYASLRSPVESNIAPKTDLEVGTVSVKGTSSAVRFEDFWRWIVLAAMAVLGFEWWYFARRS
ncbi:MAG: BatA and WFA domain-containing protein [Armatimonadetes bacterium]|nr:BatA and WFA domain-containing protein [Armatimonadota bacterium]